MKSTHLPDGTPFRYVNKLEMDFMYKDIFEVGVNTNDMIQYADGDTILDVGANIGLFLHFVTKKCHNAKLYAFEPIPRIFDVLRANFENSKEHQVRLIRCGVSRAPGEAVFTYLPNCTARSTMFPEHSPTNNSVEGQKREEEFNLWVFKELPNRPLRIALGLLPSFARRMLARGLARLHAKAEQVTCEIKSISQIIEENKLQHIDLLKIDAENSEVEILKGIQEDHWPRIKQLIVEIHPGPDEPLDQVLSILDSHGLTWTVGEDQMQHPAPTVFARRPKMAA
ncbi:MAG: FkbM family methyltransferase [Planctomycetaceae bacterium]